MFRGFFERCLRIVAEAVPARIAYFVALRVLCHASVRQFTNIPADEIGALEALNFWHEDKVLPPRFRKLKGLAAELRASGPPIFDQSATFSGTTGTIRPREVGPGESLAEGDILYGEESQPLNEVPADVPRARSRATQ